MMVFGWISINHSQSLTVQKLQQQSIFTKILTFKLKLSEKPVKH
jgi:hypothetical protein